MAQKLEQKLASLKAKRRKAILAKADQLEAEYVTLQNLRKARDLTQVELASSLGIQQATVAKYERQSDLLISTLRNYVGALGGSLKLVVEFPGASPVQIDSLGDIAATEPKRKSAGNS